MDIHALQSMQPAVTGRVQAIRRPAVEVPAAAGAQPKAPVYDEYIPGDSAAKQSAGLYQIAHDEDGTPRIRFDDPEKGGPEKAGPERRAETTTCSTDKVDRELESLRREEEQLQERLRSASADPEQSRDLEKQLEQIQRELQQKDNDGYRRQHAVFS